MVVEYRVSKSSDRDADARSDVAHQIEKGGALRAVARRQGREGRGAQRHEYQAETETLHDAGADDGGSRYVGREQRHLMQGLRGQEQSDHNQDAVGDTADEEHGSHGPEAPRGQRKAGGQHRIVHQLFKIGREQGEGRQQDAADAKDQELPQHEIAIAKHLPLEKRMLRGEYLHQEQVCREQECLEFDPDFGCREPVDLLATVEKELQRSDGNRKKGKAEHIEAHDERVRRFVEEQEHPTRGQKWRSADLRKKPSANCKCR